VKTTAVATGLAAGTYTVTITDANGCTTTAQVTVTQPALLVASATNTGNVACFGGINGSATASGTGGVAPYAYSWNTTPVTATATVTGLAAGTYTVTITDANGNTATAQVTITQPAAVLSAVAQLGNDATCLTSSNGSVSAVAAGGTAPYTYSWNTTPIQTTATAINLAPGSYLCTVTDALGCLFTSNSVGVGTTDDDCDGIANTTEGKNAVPAIDTDGDTTPDYLDLDSDNDCIPDAFELTADTDNDLAGNWRDVDSDGDNIPDAVEAAGSCTNPVDTDGDGFPDFLDLDSDGDGIPDQVEAGDDGNNPVDTDNDGTPDFRDLDSDNDGKPDAQERGNDGSNPVDTDGDGTPDFRDIDVDGDGILDAFESETEDCDGDGIVDVLDPDLCDPWIPTGFSPNGDMTNDVWNIRNLQYAANNEVVIVNRWGEVVYQVKGYDNTFDGTPNVRVSQTTGDGKLPDGTYYFIFKDLTNNRNYSGYVFITR
jgi:gliding motility-associated-like protein